MHMYCSYAVALGRIAAVRFQLICGNNLLATVSERGDVVEQKAPTGEKRLWINALAFS